MASAPPASSSAASRAGSRHGARILPREPRWERAQGSKRALAEVGAAGGSFPRSGGCKMDHKCRELGKRGWGAEEGLQEVTCGGLHGAARAPGAPKRADQLFRATLCTSELPSSAFAAHPTRTVRSPSAVRPPRPAAGACLLQRSPSIELPAWIAPALSPPVRRLPASAGCLRPLQLLQAAARTCR